MRVITNNMLVINVAQFIYHSKVPGRMESRPAIIPRYSKNILQIR
jgi:hypothetical protein